MVVVADTSFIVAYLNRHDNYHKACLEVHKQQIRIILPQTVLAEVAYFIMQLGGNSAMLFFLENLKAAKFEIMPLEREDLDRIVEFLKKYGNTRLDFVDLTVAVIAERMKIDTILTLDRRDFSIIRPKHVPFFTLLPS